MLAEEYHAEIQDKSILQLNYAFLMVLMLPIERTVNPMTQQLWTKQYRLIYDQRAGP